MTVKNYDANGVSSITTHYGRLLNSPVGGNRFFNSGSFSKGCGMSFRAPVWTRRAWSICYYNPIDF